LQFSQGLCCFRKACWQFSQGLLAVSQGLLAVSQGLLAKKSEARAQLAHKMGVRERTSLARKGERRHTDCSANKNL
jgi:hypothetical protein